MASTPEIFKGFARKDNDNKDATFRKLLILLIASSCSFFGVIWSALYYTVFGVGLTALLPFSFAVIVGAAIVVSHFAKNHLILVYTQLTCITWISAMIQWSIGSMDSAGIVIAWSFLGPLGALIFLSGRQAMFWMAQFVLIVIISAVVEPQLLGYELEVSSAERTMFYIMNLGTSAVVVFGASFWFVNTIQQEKSRSELLRQKIQTLFGQHVSTEVADKLLTNESQGSLTNGYDASIMFVDIRDFTVFSRSRSPKEVVNFQNTLFGELIDVVREHGGMVNQLLGDGMLIVFGAPVENETHAVDGIKAGFAILEKTNELARLGEIPATKLGIGLHTGRIIAGEVGNNHRKLYSVSGTTVIIASRIEQLNKTLGTQFLVSDAICQKAHSLEYDCTDHGLQELKGIEQPVKVLQLA